MNKRFLLFILLMAFAANNYAQISPKHYLVNLADKNNSKYTLDKPEEFLSERAIARRMKYKIPVVENDLPASEFYIDSLKRLGLKIVNVSKWMNSVSVFSEDTLLIDTLDKYSFVRSVGFEKEKVALQTKNNLKKSPVKQFGIEEVDSTFQQEYGNSFAQIELHNGHLMHKDGYNGAGIHIAILDGGFYKVDELPAFDSLRQNGQILGTRDFVDGDKQVYDADNHGMKVLSTIAGNVPGQLIGTAPKASFWLLRSERVATEFIIEEHNWLAAAEFADSVGADMINSSLGYSDFDDNATDHIYAEMDGNSTIVTKAADFAASKGMLVVTSAGNEGFGKWKYITAPADADSILTVGAVKPNGKRAYFSSYGPSYDERIKPDVCAIGLPSVVSSTSGHISTSSGTSFSAPTMTGLVACLWQAHPELNNMEIIDLVKRSSSQFSQPDTSLGYGIPDIYAAHIYANSSGGTSPIPEKLLKVYPNPFSNQLNVEFFSQTSKLPYELQIQLLNMQGRAVLERFAIEENSHYSFTSFGQLEGLVKGLYILRLRADNIMMEHKVIKN